jgi:hypothetical protein
MQHALDCIAVKANASFAWGSPGAGEDVPSVAGMKRPPLLLMTLLLAGCSSSGGAVAVGTATPAASPSTTVPTQSPTVGGATAVPAEKNPPGDIPDSIAFVAYRNAVGRYAFRHPEGWSETTRTSSVTFTDKLNGVQAMPGTAMPEPTVPGAKATDVPALQRSQTAFELRSVAAVSLPGGKGVRIVYRRNSAPDPVTGRQYRDEVERYEIVSAGREVVVELFGPVGADNVDAYRTMIDSLRLA